jgi:ABC-2 type transport system permease protein
MAARPRPPRRGASRLSASRLLAMARKETLHLLRDPRSLGLAFVLPAVMVLAFGWIITFDIRFIRMGVYDEDRSAASRALVDAFTASSYFVVTEHLARYDDVEPLLDRGAVRLVLVIPPRFAARLAAGGPAPMQALVDGSDANTATFAMTYARGIVAAYSTRALFGAHPVTPRVTAATRVWYNEELRSSNMIVPGLIAVIMMIIAAMLTSLTIAREWERGTMEQLAATPVHPAEVIVGKLLPYLAIGMIDLLVTGFIGDAVFRVPFRGSLLFFLGASFFFLIGTLSLGILLSAALKSQMMAVQIAMVVTYLPSFLLSGFMFDIINMPKPLQVISLVVPARYFITMVRGIMLKGVGPAVLWPYGLGMILFGAIGLTLAVRAFRKELA